MPLPPLATAADLAAALGRTFTTGEQAQAEALLGQASAMVRAYLRQDITRATTTDTFTLQRSDRQHLASPFDHRTHGQVLLPQRPVEEVTEVRVNDLPTADWWLDGSVLRVRTVPWQGPRGRTNRRR
ncbi:hypothetical protein LUW77_03485 [Streptomyces radiopugnans]|nr:hypothetical protein LUW77_03485 [Streptomyces radiopugnans]